MTAFQMLSDQGFAGRISSSITSSRLDQSGCGSGLTGPVNAPPGMGPSGPSKRNPPNVSSSSTTTITVATAPRTQRRIRTVVPCPGTRRVVQAGAGSIHECLPWPVTRLAPLDALRGLIVVLMALDHANAFVARMHSTGEFWGGPFPEYATPLAFVTRPAGRGHGAWRRAQRRRSVL